MEPPPTPLIKEKYNGNSDEDCFKLKLRRDHTYSSLDLYEFKMSLFDHYKPEECLLFIHSFNMNLAATGTLEMDTNIRYLCTLVHGKALCQFYLFFAEVENIETLNVAYYIRCLALYFIPVNFPNKSVRCATE